MQDADVIRDALERSDMHPVSIDGCFGWLHSPGSDVDRNTAVLVCPGLRSDAVDGYRALHLLANSFAAAGFPTLRLHYLDTGNSQHLHKPEHWEAWEQNIYAGAEWLRQQVGVDRIVLCGIRIGALLAASVAEKIPDINGLLLLAPVFRGRTYIRQLSIEARLASARQSGSHNAGIEDLEFSPKTIQLIDQLDLRQVNVPQGCRVGVWTQTASPVLSECLDLWKQRGIEAECNDFSGLEPMLRPTFMNHQAAPEVDRIADWLRQRVPVASVRTRPAKVPPVAAIETPDWTETPLWFGPDRSLFGMLCRPSGRVQSDLVLIIGNGSGDPHCAPAAVELARPLAAAGIASLRIDFAGVGDSSAATGETHVFETDRTPDFSAAIDALSDLGYRRFVTQGLCSGAYHAFHAAVGDSRVCAALLVNLPLFHYEPGYPVELLRTIKANPTGVLKRLRGREVWAEWLLGERTLRERLDLWGARFRELGDSLRRRITRGRQPVRSEQSALDCIKVVTTRARIQFLFGENDPGIDTMWRAFGSQQVPHGASVEIVPGLDHALTREAMRKVVAEQTLHFLKHSLQDADRAEVIDATVAVRSDGRGASWSPASLSYHGAN